MNFTTNYFQFFILLFLFFPSGAQALEPISPQPETSTSKGDKLAVPLGPLVTVRLLDWGNYIVELEPELQKYFKHAGTNVKFQYVKRPISTASDLLKRSSANEFDIATPSISFFEQETELKKSLAKLRLVDTPLTFARLLPDMVSNSGSICVPVYGGWMSVYTKDLSLPVNDFTIFENPKLEGLYALPQQEPWHIAYLVYQLLKTPSNERFTKASLQSVQFRDKYKTLIANAGLIYSHYNASLVDLEKLKLLYGFGFKLPKVWKSQTQIKNLPYYLDCLAMTQSASQDPWKMRVFNLMQKWMLSKYGQNLVTQKIEGTFDITSVSLDINGLYTGLDSERMKILNSIHNDAVARRPIAQ